MNMGKLFKIVCLGNAFLITIVFQVFAGNVEMKANKAGWVFFSDQVMGGKSQGKAELLDDLGDKFIRLEGNVTTANNGGFIQVRAAISGLAREVKGITLKIRGNGEKYFVFIRTSGTVLPWQFYKADFPSKSEWSEVNLEFSQFTRSSAWLSNTVRPESIKSIGIVAYGRDHQALIDIADLKFF